MNLLIVEQEPAVRARLIELCERGEDLRVIGEASSGRKAIQAVEVLRPNLLLLDAELPDMTGFDVLQALRARYRRRTIMVTPSAQHAATTFTAGALDYLVKPVSAEAFATAILRAQARFMARRATSPDARPAVRPAESGSHLARCQPLILIGEREHRLYPLDPHKIDYIESAGNYVSYHVAGTQYIARESIKRLHAMLYWLGFVRIERSLLLNIRAISYSQPCGRSTFEFTLVSGKQLHSGSAYRDTILRVLPLRRRASSRSCGVGRQ
jgi:two-component system, LytTR family, response regulator